MRFIKRGCLFLSYWLPPLIIAGIIFYFSSQPAGSPALESFPTEAGVGHFGGYGLLGLFLYRALNRGWGGWSGTAAGRTLVIGILYAISDEIHQLFVPGREASVNDVLIDGLGLLAALLFIRTVQVVAARLAKA